MSVTFEEILYKKCEEKGIKVVSKYINDVMLLDVDVDTTEHDNTIMNEILSKALDCDNCCISIYQLKTIMDRISISRFQANYKTDKVINIKIIDDDDKLVYQGEMTLSDFADCITGRVEYGRD